jgi:tetratricopeptide (TPR) repeat protein
MAFTMRWLHTEYILKGVYLGLLLFAALHEPEPRDVGVVSGAMFAGLAIFLCLGGYQKIREGYRPRGHVFSFILFLILENPVLVYLGVLTGLLGGTLWVCKSMGDAQMLALAGLGGAALGVIFWLLRSVQQRWYRLGLSLVLGVVLVAGALACLGRLGELAGRLSVGQPADPVFFGAQMLLGIPFFYLLTFAGREEETEIEIGIMCAALGLGVAMLTRTGSPTQSLGFAIPLMLYFWYTTQILPKLRVFKHALRGLSYAQIGRHRQAILSFRRALQFNPSDALAREGLWSVHRAIDLSKLASDPELLAVVDLDMCLERSCSLLMESRPAPEKLQEALRLLNLVLDQRPDSRATVYYWRAVAYTHARDYDQAAAELRGVLDPSTFTPDDAQRRAILLSAWQLALLSGPPALIQRAGTPELVIPGRRMEAIAAVERYLAGNPDDQDIFGFKRILYQDLTEAEYNAAAGNTAAKDFDHAYAHQLGLALKDDAGRWQRGVDYLRIAARGLPRQAPSIFTYIALAHSKAGDGVGAWKNYQLARDTGRSVGAKNLEGDDKDAYFAAVKILAEAALKHDMIDEAIENYHLCTENERCGLETLRTLADLYERKGDCLYACRITEQALLYNAKDKDLLARKDKYYWSITPEDLQARLDYARSWFDVNYCLNKSQAVLDAKAWDLDSLDWAQHLATLAHMVKPESLSAKVLLARALLRRGEKDQALALLERVHSPRPQKFADDDEDAWYTGSKLLGELYLYDFHKPDLAVECFRAFRESTRSGADTLYKLGQAYEQLGDRPRAIKCYQQVAAFIDHPLAPDAQDALRRLEPPE